jgi:RNA polymerase sigma-70 factor (ECF subfamily)
MDVWGAVRLGMGSLGLELRGDAPATAVGVDGGHATVAIFAATAAPCAHAGPLFVCVLGSVGWLEASGARVQVPRSGSALFPAVGPRAGLDVPLGTKLTFRNSGGPARQLPSPNCGAGRGTDVDPVASQCAGRQRPCVPVSVMDRRATGQVSGVQTRTSVVRPDFRVIFEEHFTYVWNSLRHFGVRTNDLEDLAHEVFFRVHERLGEYDPSRSLRPWLFAFAFRVAASHRRLARHQVEVLGTDPDPADDGLRADDALIRRDDLELALKALDAVELDRRAVFVLHEMDETPIPDVASALGIPTSTAYSRLRLARQEFNVAIKRLLLTRGDR